MPPAHPGPVLVCGCAWLGDMVMSQSLLRTLHARDETPIDLIASPWNADAAKLLPEVREVIVADFKKGSLDWGKRKQLGLELSSKGYAAAYILPNTIKSALLPWWARIPRRIGWRGEWRYGILTECYHPRHAPAHRARSFAALAHPPEADFELLQPAIDIPADMMEDFRARHQDYANDRWVAICPGAASHPVKIWPTERYGKLADWLDAKGYRVVLLGSEGDKRWTQEVSAASDNKPIDLAGKISLREVACILSCCRGVIANDSGLMHLGGALGVPTLGIFGHTNPSNYHPLGTQATYVEPAEKSERTMTTVSLQAVQDKLASMGL